MKTKIPSFLIALLIINLVLSQNAHGVTPAPDGGYPNQNTAVGDNALLHLTTGTNNTAVGFNALLRDMTGSQNTAIGSQALSTNRSNSGNTAIGFQALFSSLGFQNTATGAGALSSDIFGGNNTANGFQALFSNRNGSQNTATGDSALGNNINGNENTASGAFTMINNTSGLRNTANGALAMWSNTTGGDNTAGGYNALVNNSTGSSNIALGRRAGFNLTTGSDNIDIGNEGVAGESNTIRIGTQGTQTATFIAGISEATVTGTAVVVGSSGQLGVAPSSARYKEAIKPMGKASEAILGLQPVTFRYKKELDSAGIPQFGLVAEDVEKMNPDLVARDEQGKPYTVRYDAVNAMLLNEFLKEHRKTEKLEATVAVQQKQIEALTAGLQKVSAQVEMSRTAPQMVVNER